MGQVFSKSSFSTIPTESRELNFKASDSLTQEYESISDPLAEKMVSVLSQ